MTVETIPAVVILSVPDYARMIEAGEERFKMLDRIKSKLPNLPGNVVSQDVAKAVTAVRKRHD